MKSEAERALMLDTIRRNIAERGCHIYVVSADTDPRFAYTIGLNESLGFELILAGAIFYMFEEIGTILNDIARPLREQGHSKGKEYPVEACGSFTLREAHSTWTTPLMLGALDYYQIDEVKAYQVVPNSAHWTIDVPDMTEPWSAASAPVWQWLHDPWSYAVSPKAAAMTNLAALHGQPVTEPTRWEEDYWELFAGAGPDVTQDEMRVVSLGTLLAADRSLEPVIGLQIGKGLSRDAESDWHPWGNSEPANE